MDDPASVEAAPAPAAASPASIERVAQAVEERGLWAPGEPLLIGCSGGADSTCLLAVLSSLRARSPVAGVPLHVAYVDHGLRPGTEAEAQLVAALAARCGSTFERLAVVVSRRGNLMAAARRARYQALADCARRRGVATVAVGHTVTDQAETVAFRRRRGDPEEARAGMPSTRPLDDTRDPPLRLVRPLLAAGVTREETAGWVRERGLSTVDDPSNASTRFARVRLRAELRDAGEPAVALLLSEAARRSEQLALDEAEAEALGPLQALDADWIAAARPAVLLRLLRRAGLFRAGPRQARALAALAAGRHGSACIDLGAPYAGRDPSARTPRGERLVAERRYRTLRIGPPVAPPGEDAVTLDGPGRYRLLGRLFEVVVLGPGDPPPMDPVLDGALLQRPLLLRNLRPGDRWRGPRGGRKLSDVLIDHKVPRELRRGLALLAPAGGGEVLWIEGLGASATARARPSSATRFLVRSLCPSETAPERPGGDG